MTPATPIAIHRLTDFAYAAALKRFYALDWEGNLFTWKDGAREPEKLKGELSFPVIACTDAGDVYLHVGDSHTLYHAPPGGTLAVCGQDLYLGFLARGAAGSSILVVTNDSIVGTSDNILRCHGNRLEPVAAFDTSDVAHLAELKPGVLVYSDSSNGRVMRRQGDRTDVLSSGLQSPGAVAVAGNEVYCIGHGQRLYRILADGTTWYVDLTDVGFPEKYPRLEADRGLFSPRNGTLWLAGGDRILSLELSTAQWRHLQLRN